MSWGQWRDRIAQAIEGSYQTIDSLEADLAAGRAHLWFAPDACLVVELSPYPGGAKVCQVTWAAGELPEVLAALAELEAWAKRAGCTEMLIEGQAAWARVLRGSGYEPWSVTIRKGL